MPRNHYEESLGRATNEQVHKATLDCSAFDTFWYWINERHQIWCNREAGQKAPWTKDPILQTYRFCNVFRELDVVTRQFKELIRDQYGQHPNLWFGYCLARQINWPDTVAEIMAKTGFPEVWNPAEVIKVMQDRKARGEKLYTGAYVLTGGGVKLGEDKASYTVNGILDPVWKGVAAASQFPLDKTIQETTMFLECFSGWGGFLAYEVATDLRHTRYLSDAPDIMTWANPGPGAKRGLNRIFHRPLDKGLRRSDALEEMRWLLRESPMYLDTHVPALEMRDIEHSLCEVDKYLRVKNGEGRPRAKYEGGRG